jgi:hypothetical protein
VNAYGFDPAALDRHITGNWGADSVPDADPDCDACSAENLADDADWSCPYNGDVGLCEADKRAEHADALYDAWKDGDLR